MVMTLRILTPDDIRKTIKYYSRYGPQSAERLYACECVCVRDGVSGSMDHTIYVGVRQRRNGGVLETTPYLCGEIQNLFIVIVCFDFFCLMY